MPRYFLDVCDNDNVFRDDDGIAFADFEQVKVEVTKGLADMARDVLPGSTRRTLAINVRDEADRPALTASIAFEGQITLVEM